MVTKSTCLKIILPICVAVCVIIMTAITLCILLRKKNPIIEDSPDIIDKEEDKRNAKEIKVQERRFRRQGGVVSNGYECAKIGGNILRRGGSVADAAITAMLCEGLANPSGCGAGGGFLLTIYIKSTGKAETLISRETAPSVAHEHMFYRKPSLVSTGPLAVAVPGEIKGYWILHKKYGKLPWKELFKPVIELCKKGIFVTNYMARTWRSKQAELYAEPTMRDIFIDPKTNKTWTEGSYYKRIRLAHTLQIIAKDGADALYNGTFTKMFVEEIRQRGGIITEEDMHNYKPYWTEPLEAMLEDNMTLYTMPPPGGGVILTFMLNILSDYLDEREFYTVKNIHRIVEAFKFGFGRRTELGDPIFAKHVDELVKNLTSKKFALHIRELIKDNQTSQDPEYYGARFEISEDSGTANLCILSPNGDAIATTTTINMLFGAMFASKSTGIIFNDEMDDFSSPGITNAMHLPPFIANYIVPGKRPISSMSPSIIVDKTGNVRLIIGAAGGPKILTTVAWNIIKNVWFKKSLNETFRERRLHHQVIPMSIIFEDNFDENIIKGLSAIGHDYTFKGDSQLGYFSACTAIAIENGQVYLEHESEKDRRQGSSDLVIL